MKESPWKIRAFLAFQKGKVRLVLEEIKRGGLNAPLQSGALPLSAYAPLYRLYLKKLAGDKYSPATIENREHGLEAVRRYWPDFDTVPASALQPIGTRNMRSTIEQNMSLAHGQPPSKNTVNGYVSVVSYLLSFLVGLGVLDLLRALLLIRQIVHTKALKRNAPDCTSAQEEIMRAYFTKKWWRKAYRHSQIVIAFEIFMTFGIRQGMFQTLLVQHVDLPNRRITFHVNKQSCAEIRQLTLPLPESLARKLAAFIQRHGRVPGQRLVEQGNFNGRLKEAAREAGLPNWYAHACRHYVAMKLLRQGVPLHLIAWLLGHQDKGITLLRHYLQDNFTDEVNQALAKQDLRRAFDVAKPDWFKSQTPLLLGFIQRLKTAPKHVAKALIKHLHLLDTCLRSKDYAKVMSIIGAIHAPTHPLNRTGKTIYISKRHCPGEKNIIAANVRTVFTRAALNVPALSVLLRVGEETLNAVLSAISASPNVLNKIAAFFNLNPKQLSDPAFPEIDWDLVFDNVRFLADRFGIKNIPHPDQIAFFLNRRTLPSGTTLKALADYARIDFAHLFEVPLAKNPHLIQRPVPAAEITLPPERIPQRAPWVANLKANFQVLSRLKGVIIRDFAQDSGLRQSQAKAYAGGHSFPPPEKLAMIAQYFGVTSEHLLDPPAHIPTAAQTGRLISDLLKLKNLSIWEAILRARIGYATMRSILDGQRLPNGHQLHRLAKFLEVEPAQLLGITASPAPAFRPAQAEGKDRVDVELRPAD